MGELWIWMDLWKHALGTVAAIATAIAVLWKLGRIPVRDFFWNIRFMLNARAYHTEIDSKLNTIMLQLVPNGGSSIRDSLDRIERKQHVLGAFQKTQLNTHAKALFEANNKGQYTWVNRPYNRMTNFQNPEVMGDGWINVVAPECRTSAMRKWEDAVQNGREFDEDLWYIKPDRTTRYKVNVHAYTVADKDGAIEGYLGEVTDLHVNQTEPINCAEYSSMVQ